MQLSVVILNYNVRYFLEQCVKSVEMAIANLDAEIIVVDNNSSDDSVAMMRMHFPNVKLIANTENSGFPKGNNIGVAQAKGEYVCILNPDTVVAEDTFEKILAFARSKPNLGIVGVRLIDGAGKFLPESKRGIPTPWVAFTKISGLSRLSSSFNKYYAPHVGELGIGKVDILVGAFMVMKRDLYNEVGGFDENCFMYSDDIDLSYMVLKSGKSNYYFGETTAIHYKGESTVKDRKYMQRFQEAMDFFYKKHFRKSMFFDAFMKSGAYFYSIFKKSQSQPERKVFGYALISEDDDLAATLQPLLKKPIQFFPPHITEIAPQFQVLFDVNELGFSKIISAMDALHKSGATFKIVHKNEGFLIGSNSSNDRGEVIRFAAHR